jgi:hypothetical protein
VDQCDGCGFEYDLNEALGAASAVLSGVDELVSLLSNGVGNVTSRPNPETWSPHEYGCHVRDVLIVQRERVLAARFIDRPSFNPMGRDERVELDGYAEQRTEDVVRQLGDSARLFANVLRRLDEPEWERSVIYNYPQLAERSLRWVAVHTLHEVRHHLMDVRCQLG